MSPAHGNGTPEQQTPAPPTPLAITGIGCLFPGGAGARGFWASIKNKVDCIGPVPETHWRPEDYFDADPQAPDRTYAARGGFLTPVDFNPIEFGIAPTDLDAIDTAQLLGLVAAREALRDSGYGPGRDFDRSRVSVVLGVTGTQELVIPLGARLGHPRWRKALREAGVDQATVEDVVRRIADSYVEWQENSFPGLLGNVVAGRIANRLDLHGTNCVVDAACASSLSALHLAGLELQTGRADVAVTGGVDTFNDIFMYMCFSKTPALSATGDAKPFDTSGDGTILGEGLGVLVLKRLADAERDGDRIYAVIRSVGSASDGKGNAIYAPAAPGQVRTLRRAYGLADISPATVELVEAHGTGTRVGDTVEVTALTEVFREARPEGTWCALGSVKSQIGHTKAAAGAAGLIKAALALHHKVLPPTIKVKEPLEPLAPGRSPFYVNTEKRPWLPRAEHPRRAAVSSFGFGGSNFHLILEEHAARKPGPDWDGDVQIVALAADSLDGLRQQLGDWEAPLAWPALVDKACRSRAGFAADAPFRLVAVVQRDASDLARLLTSARGMLGRSPDAAFWHTPDGAYFGRGAVAGQLGVVFPGQGSQYVGMLRDVACQFPEMLDVLSEANRVFDRWGGSKDGRRLTDFIYPHPAFKPDQRQRQEEELRQTDVAQPAIGAVSVGALQVLQGFGIRPEAFAGHSYGELPALCAAGCFDAEALHRLSRLRGYLMATCRGGDAGAMLAVHAPVAVVEGVIRQEGLRVILANRNAPSQSVLSGETGEILRASEAFASRQLRHTRLPVAAAFHSALVAEAEGPFRAALNEVPFRRSDRPVYANTTSRQYPDDPAAIRATLAGQLARPVDFMQEVANMSRAGVRTFLEVGPGATLSRLVASILEADGPADSPWDAFSLDASGGKRSGILDLGHTLARLAARGYGVALTRWEPAASADAPPASRPGLIVPLSGANYVKPKKTAATSQSPATVPPPARPPASSNVAPAVPSPPLSKPTMTEPKPTQPAPLAQTPTANAGGLAQALQVTQQSLAAFQRLQEQTAQLHRQFLENQESAQRTLQVLVEQQQAILTAGGVLQGLPVLVPVTAPVSPPPARLAEPLPPVTEHAPVNEQPTPPSAVNGRQVITAPPAPTPSPAPEVPAGPEVNEVLLAVVAEKTGYPVEMLELNMALDADLGIDSIKRVEILSALQERLPEAPAVKPEHLGTLHTLRDVAEFLSAGKNTPAVVPTSNGKAAIEPKPIARPTGSPDAAAVLLAVVAEKTGYPVEMLELNMALDADLGIDSIKRVEIFSALQERLPGAPTVKPEHLGTLHTLQDVCNLLAGESASPAHVAPAPSAPAPSVSAEHRPAADAAVPRDEPGVVGRYVVRPTLLGPNPSRPRVSLPPGTVVWLIAEPSPLTVTLTQRLESLGCRPQLIGWNDTPASQQSRTVGGLLLLAPEGTLPDDFPLKAFRWIRHSAAALRESATRGGAFLISVARLDGAFGLSEFGQGRDPLSGALAGLVKTAASEWSDVVCKAIDVGDVSPADAATAIAEEAFARGPLEVGIRPQGRYAFELIPAPAEPAGTPALGPDDVVVVTGGARGVTFAGALEIARRFGSKLALFGRTPLEDEPQWLRGANDEADVKQALAAHLGASASPRAVGERARHVFAHRELRANLARLESVGARFVYLAVDVADRVATAKALRETRAALGPVTALVHGAGILADRRIEDLSDEQFQAVYATKVGGLANLLALVGEDPLRAIVLYSSTTARFGRTGQSAYAAANEVLNKVAQQQARQRPGCRVSAINWGPWEGGMVTPALKKVFASEGVGLIPLQEGAQFLAREIAANDQVVEVVALAGEPPSGPVTAAGSNQPGARSPALHLAFEQRVTLNDLPVLRSHVIDGRAVFPLALHLEWLAHAGLHGNPGMVLHGVDDLRVLKGLYLDEVAPTELRVYAGKSVKRDKLWSVPVELRGRRDSREVLHSRAEVILGTGLPGAEPVTPIAALEPYPHAVDEAYRSFLFHGDDLRGIERVEGVGPDGLVGWSRTAPAPAVWLAEPLRSGWLADPLVLDSSFQMAILWSFAAHETGSLPCYAGSYRQFVRTFPPGQVRVALRVTRRTGSVVRMDIDYVDPAGKLLARMRDYECVLDPGLNEAFRRNLLSPAVR